MFVFLDYDGAIVNEVKTKFPLIEPYMGILLGSLLILSVLLIARGFLSHYEERKENEIAEQTTKKSARVEDTLEFYSINQEMIRYHGERMWDSMKIFGIVFPATNGILTLAFNYWSEVGGFQFGKDILASLFVIPLTFTIIFWFNVYREYLRFLEYAQMSWRAEELLGFHESRPELNNKSLIISRFKNEPPLKPKFGKSFWTTLCFFFGSSFVIQIALIFWVWIGF
jgi:hypothetical protein